MSGLFYHCISLKTIPDIISRWNPGALYDGEEIVDGCVALQLNNKQKEILRYKGE